MGGSRPGRTQFRKVLPAIPAHGGGDGAGQPTIFVGELRQTNFLGSSPSGRRRGRPEFRHWVPRSACCRCPHLPDGRWSNAAPP
eukprot:scaffold10410_cov144-Isochrysis_galbana.AAC.5